MELIAAGIAIVGAPFIAYKGGIKLKNLFKYKKIKKTIYNEINIAFNSENVKDLFNGLKKLKNFDLDETLGGKTNKLSKILEKLGLPQDAADSGLKLAKYIDEMKDKVIDEALKQPEILKLAKNKIEQTFALLEEEHKNKIKEIDDFKLSSVFKQAKEKVASEIENEIKNQLKKGNDKLMNEELSLSDSIKRQGIINKFKLKQNNRLMKSKKLSKQQSSILEENITIN
jgi:hypothetical protein